MDKERQDILTAYLSLGVPIQVIVEKLNLTEASLQELKGRKERQVQHGLAV
jgi:hypothetical protein